MSKSNLVRYTSDDIDRVVAENLAARDKEWVEKIEQSLTECDARHDVPTYCMAQKVWQQLKKDMGVNE